MTSLISGPDCSRHQGVVDWGQVKAAGHAFAIVKLTDGLVYRYVTWGRENLPKVRTAGLVPGAYHWLYGPQDGAAQARVYVDEVNRLGGFCGLLAVVDVERDEDGSVPSYACVTAFCAEWHRLVPGRTLILYTGRWFWRDILGDPPAPPGTVLWHSEYEPSLAEVADGPELDRYGGWTDATLWQFTSNDAGLGMDVPGVSTLCDLNRFFGTYDDLLALAGGGDDMALTHDETVAAVMEALNKAWSTPASKVRVGAEDVLERIGNPSTQAGKAFAAGVKAAFPVDAIADAVAEAIAAKLPAGPIDAAALQTAVREVFAEVKARFEFAAES
jgi:lysozyme